MGSEYLIYRNCYTSTRGVVAKNPISWYRSPMCYVLAMQSNKVVLETKKSSKVSPEFLKIAKSVGTKYSGAFKELEK